MARRFLTLAVFALAAWASGCGPMQSTSLIMDADVQLEAARSADAPRLAPYEFTAAEAYLHKAREEQGYADYEVSIDFADKALKFARQAKEKAMTSKGEAPGSSPSSP